MTTYDSWSQLKGLTWIKNYENIIKWEEGKEKLLPPVGITIDLTTTCSLRCVNCNAYRSWNLKQTLDSEEVFRIIDLLKKWRDESGRDDVLKSLCLAGGGEPTLHPKFPEIVKYAHKAGFQVGISTNGLGLNNGDIVKAIVEHAEFCGVSFDSGSKEVWSKCKGVNDTNHDLLIRGVKKLLKYWNEYNRESRKCDITYKYLINQYNQEDILNGCKLAKSLGFKTFYVRPAAVEGLEIYNGKDFEFNVKKITEQLFECKKLEDEDFKVFYSFGRVNDKMKRVHNFKKCHATPLLVQICADGCVYYCIDCRYVSWAKLFHWSELGAKWGSVSHRNKIKKIDINKCVRCFVKGTKIITSKGIKNIEDIKIGDEVLTHKGRYKKVMRTFKRKYNGEGISIKNYGNYNDIISTPEHPLLIGSLKECIYSWNKTKRCYPNCNYRTYMNNKNCIDKCNPEVELNWKNSNEITANEFSCFPIINLSNINEDILLSRLGGYYLSEGYSSNNKVRGGTVRFTFNKKERSYIEEVKNIIKIKFNIDCYEHEKGNVNEISFYSKKLKDYLCNKFGRVSKEKHLSEEYMIPSLQLVNLLQTFFYGDGNQFEKGTNKIVSFSTSSELLAYQTRTVLLMMGIPCRINKRIRKGCINGRELKQGIIYSIFITQCRKISELFNLKWKKDYVRKENQICFINNNLLFMPIRNVKKININEDVYNLEVEDDNSYVVNNMIVHNCAFGHYNQQIQECCIEDKLYRYFP